MEASQTLWERFMNFLGFTEKTSFNPLNVEIGHFLWLDILDYRDIQFKVSQIFEYVRVVNDERFYFTDYVLQDISETVSIILRYDISLKPHYLSGCTTLLLTTYDEFAYSEDFLNVLNDDTGQFDVRENDTITESYMRVGGLIGPCVASKNNTEVNYWNYSRETVDEANQPIIEYLFVEMNNSDGWTQLYKGVEIDMESVKTV